MAFSNRKIPKIKRPYGLTKVQKKQTRQLAKAVVNRTSETKRVYDNDTNTVDVSGTIFELTKPVRGDDVDEYNGARIEPSYFQFEGDVLSSVLTGGTAPASQWQGFRFLLIQWRPDTAVDFPTLGEIFEATISPYTMSFYNTDYQKQFKVLKDVSTYLVSSAGNPHSARKIKFSIPMKKLSKITFNEGSTTGENHLFLVMWSSEAVGSLATVKPKIYWRSKMSYKDV